MLLISSSGREKTEQMEQIHGSQQRGKKRERSRVGGAETDCSWLMCDNLILETGSGTASWAGLTGNPLTVTNDFHISRSSSALYSQRCQCCSQADGSFTMIYILLYVVTVVEAHSNDMTFSITWWGQGKCTSIPCIAAPSFCLQVEANQKKPSSVMFNHNNTEWAPQVTCKRHANFGSGLDLRRHKDVNKKHTRKTDAHVQARTLTSEIDFSIQVLDLRCQTQLEQVQTATQGRKEVSINMSEDVQKKRWASPQERI